MWINIRKNQSTFSEGPMIKQKMFDTGRGVEGIIQIVLCFNIYNRCVGKHHKSRPRWVEKKVSEGMGHKILWHLYSCTSKKHANWNHLKNSWSCPKKTWKLTWPLTKWVFQLTSPWSLAQMTFRFTNQSLYLGNLKKDPPEVAKLMMLQRH